MNDNAKCFRQGAERQEQVSICPSLGLLPVLVWQEGYFQKKKHGWRLEESVLL